MPGLHGHRDARCGKQVAEAEKIFVVEKQLRIEVRRAGVHLFFQVADIRRQVGAFGVAFG